MKNNDDRYTPGVGGDAVLSFFALVRAVADGNVTRQKEQVENLRRCGFDVKVRRDALERRKAVRP